MNLLLKWKWYLVGGAILASFYGGWTLSSWHTDSVELKTQKKVQELQDAFRDSEARTSRTLEDKLQELKANERVIEREKLKIIDNPIYLNECLDGPGVRLLNRQRGEQDSNTTEPTN